MDLTAPGLQNELIHLEPLDERFREQLRASDAVNSIWLSLPAIQRGAGFDAYYDHVLKQSQENEIYAFADRKSTRLNSSHVKRSRMPSSA